MLPIQPNKPFNIQLRKTGECIIIDKEFFKLFNENKVPFVRFITEGSSKILTIFNLNKSFIKMESNNNDDYKWEMFYDKSSSLCKSVALVHKTTLNKEDVGLEAFPSDQYMEIDSITDDPAVLPVVKGSYILHGTTVYTAKDIIYPEPLPDYDFLINGNLEMLPLGSIANTHSE